MQIRNILFDLDGTLLDTTEGILESAVYAARELGYPELPLETMLQFIGPPIQQSYMKHYGVSAEEAQHAAGIFRGYDKEKALLKASMYIGMEQLCETLKEAGLRMAVATYKREDYALTLLRHFGFDRWCDPMHGADNFNVLKKEDIVRMCMEEMGALQENTVLIGDTDHDARGAAKAGIPFLAVSYGFGYKPGEPVITDAELLGVAESPMQIAEILGIY